MRKFLFLLTLVLAACGGNGDGSSLTPEPSQHLPEILNLTLSPSSAQQWEGDGSVVVTTEITFSDTGRDVATLWVRLPDGSTFEFDEAMGIETGTFSEALNIPTIQVGTIFVEIWLEDSAGDSSAHRVAEFSVIGDGQQAGDWISRLGGLPHSLSDVIWNGRVFIAVGGGGTILTSADGIYWVVRESGTDVFLDAISAHGNEIFAVGFETLLLSTDNGENWIAKSVPETIIPGAIAASSTRVVVGGMTDTFDPIMVVSEDRGDTWLTIDTWPQESMYINDLSFRDGLFVAAADTLIFHRDGGWVFASPDGAVWSDIFYDPQTGFSTVVDDGSRITVAGSNGGAITSLDGFNWTDMQTPLEAIHYRSGASNGKKLILAGDYECEFICFEPVALPMGVATTNGGMSWDVFNIGGEFLSRGMAFGNGRFVSVGQAAPLSGEGAIYTSN